MTKIKLILISLTVVVFICINVNITSNNSSIGLFQSLIAQTTFGTLNISCADQDVTNVEYLRRSYAITDDDGNIVSSITFYVDRDVWGNSETYSLCSQFDDEGGFIGDDLASESWGYDWEQKQEECAEERQRTLGISASTSGGSVSYSASTKISKYRKVCDSGAQDACWEEDC